MYRTITARSSRARLAIGATTVLILGALALTAAGASATASPDVVTVRIEGPRSTLLPATGVTLDAGTISKDGVAADSCSTQSAAGALELATRGDWAATWSTSYSAYFLTGVGGVSFPSTGARFWAFWINDAPASQGICGIVPKPGDRILFFPDCYGKSCPKNDGVLGVKAPAVAVAGRPVTVEVTAYADADGAPGPAAGATVSGGGASAKTGPGGGARLTFAAPGRFTVRVRAPHAIRTETRVCVEARGTRTCG